ncbi:MAG: COX15/CtaA family protein [Acidimicrobiia bacterium]|nr:COX15/CtaA family protein [Acidimicrobiia bacterium]
MSTDSKTEMQNSELLTSRDPIRTWLWMVAGLTAAMVVVGGFVRLSRAGLSIVSWDPVTGVLPPIGTDAWHVEFAKYQQSPEYLLVNSGMTLAEFQRIFMIEWAHRLIARIAGLMVVIPLVWFMAKRILTFKQSLRYWAVAALFGIQAVLGWVMVSSGLRDRPIVSNARLTMHLLVALATLGIVMWMAMDRSPADSPAGGGKRSTVVLSWSLLVAVVAQIGLGGLVAGMRAGSVSDTWPLMAGRWVPVDLLTEYDPWWINFIEPVGSHWLHRWIAFLVAGIAIALFLAVRRDSGTTERMRSTTRWLIAVLSLQVGLGISVVVLAVPKWLALAHQANGMAVFAIAVVICHTATRTSTSSQASTTYDIALIPDDR